MQATPNIKQASVKKFAQSSAGNSVIRNDGYHSYIPALKDFFHEHKTYDPRSGLLHWLHIIIGNAKVFNLGTYHGLPKNNLQSCPTSTNFVSASAIAPLAPPCLIA